MSARNIVIYTIHPDEWPCEYCDKAKAWLSDRGYEHEERELLADDRERMYRWWNISEKSKRTMPQIFVNDVRIGGYAELIEMEDL